jgi:hypothetical protein
MMWETVENKQIHQHQQCQFHFLHHQHLLVLKYLPLMR